MARTASILVASGLLTAVIVAYILVPMTISDDKLKRLTIDNDTVGTIVIRTWYATGKIIGFDLVKMQDCEQRLSKKVTHLLDSRIH